MRKPTQSRRAGAARLLLAAALAVSVAAPPGADAQFGEGPTLLGQVVDPRGAVVENATVQLLPVSPGLCGCIPGSQPAVELASPTARPDPTGGFSLWAPGPGLYRVEVRAPGFQTMEYPLHPLVEETWLPPLVLGPPGALPVKVEAGSAPGWRVQRRVEAPESARAGAAGPRFASAGRVVAADTGRPLGGALVWDPESLGGWVLTAADGTFRLPLCRAAATLRAAAPGYLESGAAAPGGGSPPSRPVLLRLSPAAAVRGQVVDGQGTPVAGASLRLAAASARGLSRGQVTPSQGRAEEIVVASDGMGRFALRRLAPGHFELRVSKKGFRPRPRDDLEILARPGGIDLGRLALERGVVLRGAVRDALGSLVADAEVEVREAAGVGLHRSRSDGAGSFALDGLAEGESVDVRVRHRGYAPTEVPGFEVHAGTELEVILSPGASLAGRVTDPQGAGLAGAVLSLSVEPEVEGEASGIRQVEARDLQTTEDGSFATSDLPPGRAWVKAFKPGFREATLDGVTVAAGREAAGLVVVLQPGAVLEGTVRDPEGRGVEGARVTLSDREGSVEGLLLTDGEGRFRLDSLAPGASLLLAEAKQYRPARQDLDLALGTNRAEVVLSRGLAISGLVVDGEGAPVAGAGVTAAGDGRALSPATTTDEVGRFRLSGCAPGPWQVHAEKEGFVPRRVDVRLDAETPAELRIALARGGWIEGRLLGLSGAEIAGAEVAAVSRGRLARGTVAADGTYRIAGLAPGDWTIAGRALAGAKGAQRHVDLAEGEDRQVADLDFAAGLCAAGRVSINGLSLAGASVTILAVDRMSLGEAATGRDGGFEICGLQPGGQELRVQASGLTWVRALDLEPDRGPVSIDLEAAPVGGHVVSADGASSVAGAAVLLTSVDGAGGEAQALSDSAGSFLFSLVPAGRYRLAIDQQTEGHRELEIEVAPQGSPADLVVQLSPARRAQ